MERLTAREALMCASEPNVRYGSLNGCEHPQQFRQDRNTQEPYCMLNLQLTKIIAFEFQYEISRKSKR